MSAAGRRSPTAMWLLFSAAMMSGLLFLALGTWQLQRREWKLQLIAVVQQRVHADPAPLQEVIATADPADIEYRRVRVSGVYLPIAASFAQAVTRIGAGYWMLAPFRSDYGATLFVNRGFVPASARGAQAPPAPSGRVDVVGLLRASEPAGGFLRRNDPAKNRWYSRDVLAMAERSQLAPVAPWFIDAETSAPGAGQPVAGLTVVQFRNSHLSYALTWYALAALAWLAGYIVLRESGRMRRVAKTTVDTAC